MGGLRVVRIAAGATVLAVALLVLLGWMMDVRTLTSIRPEWVSMKPNTALAFLFAGLASSSSWGGS